MTPAVMRSGPYRFYFVSHDLHEPPHVHVDRDAFSLRKVLARSGRLGLQSGVCGEGAQADRSPRVRAQERVAGGMAWLLRNLEQGNV